MPKGLQTILHDLDRPQGNSHCVTSKDKTLDDMGRILQHIGPNEVEQMRQRILTPKSIDSQCQMGNSVDSDLTMNNIPEVHNEIKYRTYVCTTHLSIMASTSNGVTA